MPPVVGLEHHTVSDYKEIHEGHGGTPRKFESWSSNKDDTRAGIPSPNFHHANGSTLSLDRFHKYFRRYTPHQIKVHEIHRGFLRLSLVLALSTMQGTVRFGSLPSQFSGSGRPTSLFPTSREDLRFNGYSEYLHAAKALYIYKHPCLLRDPYGTAVSVANRYTGLVAIDE
ncbi:hypothetical protein TNCV_1168991 [Trichonephila clavipes]|uniref:Uncharacterized protein n=1 Tax=Trichonephila clavipes TaxID=2585209 RepID=A0A8X6VTA0_TRICX|nr:hypothetical protein TNCV_1168991 [Trichonephila clavipes]